MYAIRSYYEPVYVYDEANDKKYLFEKELWVTVSSPILNELKSLLGEANVIVRK